MLRITFKCNNTVFHEGDILNSYFKEFLQIFTLTLASKPKKLHCEDCLPMEAADIS